jgi:hypothetical protein
MIMTNAQAFDAVLMLSKLDEKGMLGYAIARNRRLLTAEVQEYSYKRDELLAEFGTDMGNGQFQLNAENASRFYEALRPYSELTVDVPVMQIEPEVFYSGNLTSNQMFALEWMVDE